MRTTNNDRLKEILSKVLMVDTTSITERLARKDIEEWDSLSHLILVSEIESTFGVNISDDDIVKIKTVGDIKTILGKLGILF